MAKSILEGIVYDKTTPEGIVYAASICYPQTDLYVPISITISPDGKISMKKKSFWKRCTMKIHPAPLKNTKKNPSLYLFPNLSRFYLVICSVK